RCGVLRPSRGILAQAASARHWQCSGIRRLGKGLFARSRKGRDHQWQAPPWPRRIDGALRVRGIHDAVLRHCWGVVMSVQAISWALGQQIVTASSARHVLLCLANYAGEDGRNAFPSIARLCADTGLSERAVRDNLRRLEDAGVIERGNQAIAAAHTDRADRRPTAHELPTEDLG